MALFIHRVGNVALPLTKVIASVSASAARSRSVKNGCFLPMQRAHRPLLSFTLRTRILRVHVDAISASVDL